MGIKGLNWDEVNERAPMIAARRSSHTADDLISTITILASRLYVHDHRAHQTRIDEACRFIREHYNGHTAVDATLMELARECFIAGIHETLGEPYVPQNARIAAILIQVRARTATPEAGESLQASGQSNGENGVTA